MSFRHFRYYRLVKNPWQYKIFRFGCIGTVNTLIDLSILNLLVITVHLNPLIANLISASVAITISYFLNHHLVFRDPRPSNFKQFIHFYLVTGLSILAVQDIIIAMFTHYVGVKDNSLTSLIRDFGLSISAKVINLNLGKLIAVVGGMVWNFLWYHKVVFKHHETELNIDNANKDKNLIKRFEDKT